MQVYVTISLDPKLQSLLENLGGGNQLQLSQISAKLDSIQIGVNKIIMTQGELDTLLQGIDTLTNSIATNVAAIATVDQKISQEIDAFLAAKPAGTVLTDAEVTQLQNMSANLKTSADASTAQVATLQAIAAKGSVILPPPPPPPPTPAPTV